MNKWTILLLVTVILGCSGQIEIYSLCPRSGEIVTSCSIDHGISTHQLGMSVKFFDFQSQIDNEKLQPANLSDICPGSSAAKMKSFMDCLHTKFFSCINSDSQKAFPDVSKVKSSLDQVCKHLSDIDVPCLASTSRHKQLINCLPEKPFGESSDISTAEGYLTYYCRFFILYIPCFKKAHGTCPGKTADVWTQVLESTIPTGCNYTVNNALMKTPSWVLFIFVVFSIGIGLK